MPRPRHIIDEDEYRSFIMEQYQGGIPRRLIQNALNSKFGIKVGLTTLSTRIQEWELVLQQQRTVETPELIQKIEDYMFRIGLTEKQLLIVLRREGFSISRAGLQRIRLNRGWRRRIDDPEERLALLEKATEALLSMTDQSNALASYGRRMLPVFLRQRKRLQVPRDPLYEVYRLPGPNYQWCIDGHDKLKDFGFEIYAAIDAYSRCIIWFYVGHSNATAISVLKQYLDTVREYGIRPWFVQADLGTETPLVAAAHWNFALRSGGKVRWKEQDFEQGLRLKDSYKTATSTRNVKIEKMWESMLHCCSRQWRDYLRELEREGDFDKSMFEDQIALYAVYEDMLREELFDFVHTWNNHKIRLQRNRPHVIHGQPFYNYHFPDPTKACNWGIPVDPLVLAEMAGPVKDVDLGTCLSAETKEWCSQELKDLGIEQVRLGSREDPDRLRPFKRFYLVLRDRIVHHIEEKTPPELAYLEKPLGGVQAYEELYMKANQAWATELGDSRPREEPMVETDVEDQEGSDIASEEEAGEAGEEVDEVR
ncbi:Integrase core domain protein [Pleurostoma richardsiae]|uniref:Integrase core domain protein n=1 Tax=Pleurostoma richardsiae TaxID=41990 RepID=A0AA38VAU9_9PEZI|nr:Integrase core domain protein [Pleurostoma richardsiae]